MKYINIENVDIYYFTFSSLMNNKTSLMKNLSQEEINRANKYYFVKDQNQYIICRSLLKSILSERMNINPNKIEFNYNDYRKPELKPSQNSQNIQFNISHSYDYGIVAITTKNHIGIDIEKQKEMRDLDSITKRYFSAEEYYLLQHLKDKKKYFFDIWVQKEAIIKASGKGLSFGLSHWTVDPEKDDYFVKASGDQYYLRKLFIDDKYSAALAIMK